MSWFNRITSTARQAAPNVLSGARRLASAVITESIQIRFTDFLNWLTAYAGSERAPQVLNEIVEHVRQNYPPIENYPRRPLFDIRETASTLTKFTRVYTIGGKDGYDTRRFLEDARQNTTHVLRNNRRTKVKLIFKM